MFHLFTRSITSVSDAQLAKILFKSVVFHFTTLSISLVEQKVFRFMILHFLIVCFIWENEFLFNKSFPLLISCNLLIILSSIYFSFSGFKLRSLILLELIFVQGFKHLYNVIFFSCDHPVFLALLVDIFFLKRPFLHLLR